MGRLAGFSYRQVVRRLKSNSFAFDRQAAGSHEIWYNEKTGRFTVVAEARVTTIDVDKNGRVTGVQYVKDNQEYFQPADVVLVGGYVY